MSPIQTRPNGLVVVMILLIGLLAGCVGGAPHADDNRSALENLGPFAGPSVPPGEYEIGGAFSRVLTPGPFARLPDEVLTIESPVDGVPIEIGFVRPVTDEPVPVIALATPYAKPLSRNPLSAVGDQPQSLIENLVPHGYAFAIIAVRGSAGSGGCIGFGGHAERADLDAAVTWLGTQSWSSGNVGMIGLSYGGYAAYEVAAEGNPHLKTIVVHAGQGGDVFQVAWRNGTWSPLAFTASPLFAVVRTADRGTDALRADHLTDAALCPTTREMLLASGDAVTSGGRSEFWRERDVRADVLANYRGSMLIDQGLRDNAGYPHSVYPYVAEFENAGITVKHLLGQWHHVYPDDASSILWPYSDRVANPTPRWDWAQKLLLWFDYWLKQDPSADLGPRVEVADSQNQWRMEETWPPEDAIPQRFHLTTEFELADEPGAGRAELPVASEPVWFAPLLRQHELEAECHGCLRFTTPWFDEEFRFAGLPTLHATVTPAGPGGVVTAKLLAEGPLGIAPLTWAQMDLRFAAGGETPQDVLPGQPLVARMEFEPTDAVVPASSRLVLLVAQGASGEGDAFLTTWYAPLRPPTPLLLHVGAEASILTLHTFERADDDPRFFVPPGAIG